MIENMGLGRLFGKRALGTALPKDYVIFKRGQTRQVRCSACKALGPSTMRDYKARKRYIETNRLFIT